MKVLMLGKYSMPRNGGVERHLDALFQGFGELGGVEASLLTANDGWGTQVDESSGFRTVRASRIVDLNRLPIAALYPRWFSRAVEVLPLTPTYGRWLRKMSDADVIHLHAPNPVAEMALLAATPKCPLVVTEHCAVPDVAPLAGAYLKIHRAVLNRAAAFIVQSPNFLETSPLTKAQRSRAHIIPSSLDARRLVSNPELAESLLDLLHVEGPVWLFVGRLVDYKGLDFLLEALGRSRGTLLVVGVGPEERRLRALAHRLGVARRVQFLGALEDATVMGLLAKADALILPSTDNREGYGLVLVEAHLMGTPTISTELGTGTSWVNQHESTGLVIPPRDVGALVAAIARIDQNPDEAKGWGRAAQERARALFSVEEMSRRTLEVYRSVL